MEATFFVLSIYSPRKKREYRLSTRIAASKRAPHSPEHLSIASSLIEEDDKRDSTKLSQDVRETFPLADYFIDDSLDIGKQVNRFVKLVFGDPFITPTISEYMMYSAKAASLRSCDLSRQVGAIISDSDGTIISSGYNDVPYPGGGVYREELHGSADNRDHIIEFDPNTTEIQRSIAEFVEILRESKLLSDNISSLSSNEIALDLLHGTRKEALREARVRNLIEFGRVVHAEMHAISEAARKGRSTQGATLYCTTFPCHICARHIISSGISNVIFIEPYPKSMTRALYSREINLDKENGEIDGAVSFVTFRGVAPRLYQKVFEFRKRKDSVGNVVRWDITKSPPVDSSLHIANVDLERNLSGWLVRLTESGQIDNAPSDVEVAPEAAPPAATGSDCAHTQAPEGDIR